MSPTCCSNVCRRAGVSSPSAARSAPDAGISPPCSSAEAFTLAAGGGAVGLVIAAAGANAFRLVVPPQLAPRLADRGSVDAVVLVCAAALTIGVGIGLGAFAALRVSGDQALEMLRDASSGGIDRRGGRTRRALLIAEVAATVMLVIAAGLMLDSLSRLRRSTLGFRSERLVTLQMELRGARYTNPETVTRFGVDLVREIAAAPGIESALIWGPARPGRSTWVTFPAREGAPTTDGRLMTWRHTVSPGALRAIGISLQRGREFTDTTRWRPRW